MKVIVSNQNRESETSLMCLCFASIFSLFSISNQPEIASL